MTNGKPWYRPWVRVAGNTTMAYNGVWSGLSHIMKSEGLRVGPFRLTLG